MKPAEGVSQQIYKMRNQAFRILYDTLLESVGLGDEELYATLCLNLRRIANAKFAALTIIDTRKALPIASYAAFDEEMLPTCRPIEFRHDGALGIEMINKCKLAQVRKCVADEVCFLKYFDEETQAIAAGQGECVGISCIQGNKLYAAGMIKMPDGLPLRMSDMLDNFLNLASVLISRIQALRELGASNLEMQRILSAIGNVLIMIDEHGDVLHWNSSAEALFGISADAIRHQPLNALASHWDWPRVEAGMAEVKVRGETVFLSEVSHSGGHGRETLLNITLFPCMDQQAGIVIVGENIAHRSKEHAHEGPFRNAGIVREMTGNFLDSAMQCNLQLAERLETLSAALPERVLIARESLYGEDGNAANAIFQMQTVLSRGRKMIQSVQNLLKPENGPLTEVNLNAALESAVGLTMEEWRPIAKLERQMRSDLPLFHCRASEMNTVFVNLLRNAIQAIEGKSGDTLVQGHITVGSRMGSGELIISIEDDGEPIPAEDREKIFESFYSTRKQCGNIGQGLYMSRYFVQKYGGDIVCKSGETGRTVFEVHLPIQGAGNNPVRIG